MLENLVMNKCILLLPLLCLLSSFKAQTLDFTEVNPQPDLLEVYGGSFASGDIDGDGDTDLMMAGITPARKTALYLNDGSGHFIEQEDTGLPNASSSVTLFADLDEDGDLDLFYSGNGFAIQEFAHVYLNDGAGRFTLTDNPSLPQFADSGVDIADVDGDGDNDLVITVKTNSGTFIADVYLNDGNAVFTPSGDTAIGEVQFGAIAFIDVENDGDMDLIIAGEQENESNLTALYLNDGLGNYSIDNSTNFVQLSAATVEVADTDNDGDLDVLMSGTTTPFGVRTILYLNDGFGQFSELGSVGLQQTFAGTNAFADMDNDGDQDILVIGSQEGGLPNIYNIVYENTGNNTFIPVDTLGGEYIAACVVDDFNGDALVDIIIQGFVDKTNVYWNTSALTSIEEFTARPALNIFPNPSSGELTLDLADDTVFDLNIYNSQGQLVYQKQQLAGTTATLQLDLPAGNYILCLKFDHAFTTRKLIITK